MRKQNYLNNKDMLKEIHKSKLTYCYSLSEEYDRFDTIVESVEDIQLPETIQLAKENRAAQLSAIAYEEAYWEWHAHPNRKPSQKPKQTTYKISQSNIKILPNESNKLKLIKYYDDHNIFVLPSYTEGHPMVLLEALARRRPVIIFEDIKHVVGDKKGVFIAKRNFLNFFGTLNQIKKNYKKTYKEMMRNKLPTNKEFIEQFIKAIDDFK